ncbi:MAG: four helix bundle protein [Muribaculaceae bacterium]|nr:four helix bundle protein [Muribaculaceae bacterium]
MRSSEFRRLQVWQKSMDLTVRIYALAKTLPIEERFALADQMRRAVISIPSNIAEGYGRQSDKEYMNFLSVARGSLFELSTQVEICERLKYIDADLSYSVIHLIDEISKMLTSLYKRLSSDL